VLKVSLVMAVYNGEEFLKEALDSALSQSYPDLEIIVVNDCSSDNTGTILDSISDTRLKVIHLEQNQGAASALNTGIRQATGDWVAIQDADDNNLPARIEEQVKYLKNNPQLVGLGTHIVCIPGSGNVSKDRLTEVENCKNLFITDENIRRYIYSDCPFTHSSMMFSKDVFWEVGGYCTDYKIAYDYDLWLKLLEKGNMENLPKALVQYRIRSDSLSHSNGHATVNEIQIALSRAIYRNLSRGKEDLPRVILIGPLESCENYRDNIASVCRLVVAGLAGEDRKNEVAAALTQFQKGEADAIIVLNGCKKQTILKYLTENGLVLNQQVFNLYNSFSAAKQRFYYRDMAKGGKSLKSLQNQR